MLLMRCFNLRCLMQFQANLVTSCRNEFWRPHPSHPLCRCHAMLSSILLMDCSFLCYHVFHLYKCRIIAGSRCLFFQPKDRRWLVCQCLFLRTPFITAAVTVCVSAGMRKIQQQLKKTAMWKQLEAARKLHPFDCEDAVSMIQHAACQI